MDALGAAIINPDGFTRGYPALVQPREISDDRVHISNPARHAFRRAHREPGGVAGFGIVGYDLARRGLKALLTK